MKHPLIPLLVSAILQFGNSAIASAAVPMSWTVDVSRVHPEVRDVVRGETVALEATLQSDGKPFATGPEPVCIFWQTNGMGSAWWSRPCVATASSPSGPTNVLSATFTPAMDPGAATVIGFLGSSGSIYRAAFQLRFRHGPGAVPNALPLPTPVIDFAKVTVLNPPWSGGGSGGVDTNAVRDIVRETVDGSARYTPKYLWVYDCDDTYPKDAAWYYAQPQPYGSCSAVRDGGFLYRNYDWRFDDSAEFVVRVSAGLGRFASVGVANCGTNLTESFVTSGKPSRYYKCLPGRVVDGINENGVVCEVNVVDGDPHDYWDNPTGDIHPLAAVRWTLDNAMTAEDAATNLAARIAFPPGWTQNFHWMVADETSTYIVENGTASNVTAVAAKRVMTNFPILPDTYSGMGKERYQLLRDGEPITNAWFTRAYSPYTDWFTDFGNSAAIMEGAKSFWNDGRTKEQHRGETVYGQSWWQTVHCSVYDITNKTMRISVQESDEWYTFAVPSAGGVKPEAVREIVTQMIGAATNGLRRVDDMTFYPTSFTRFVWHSDDPDCPDGWVAKANAPDAPQITYVGNNSWSPILIDGFENVNGAYGPEDTLELTNVRFEDGATTSFIAFATRTIDSDRLATSNGVNSAFTTNNPAFVSAVHDVSDTQYRSFGDEFVYEADGFTDFTWHGDRIDAISAIGSLQPTATGESGGYTTWVMAFEMDGHYYWGDAHAITVSPEVLFAFSSDWYDESIGEWVYDYLELTARRQATGYHRSNPIDTFARQSRLDEVGNSVDSLRNRIDGETKVLRTGKEGERGSGWGYLHTSLDGDYRNWRFRVPKWTNITGTTTNDTGASQTYVSWTNGNSRSVGYSVILNNPLSWSPAWAFDRTVSETRGAQGLDAVQQADYDVGILRKSSTVSGGSTYYLGYTVEQDASMSVKVSMDMPGWTQTNRVYRLGSGGSGTWITVPGWYRPIREHVSRSWTFSVGEGYEDIATYEAEATGMFVRSEDLSDSYVSSPEFKFYTVCENEHVMILRSRDGSDPETILDETIHDSLHYSVIRVSSVSSATFEDAFAPYYKLVGTLDCGIFYDEDKDCSWQIKVRNGCFYQEKYCDGDWRN